MNGVIPKDKVWAKASFPILTSNISVDKIIGVKPTKPIGNEDDRVG
jgi:hypothetical protein